MEKVKKIFKDRKAFLLVMLAGSIACFVCNDLLMRQYRVFGSGTGGRIAVTSGHMAGGIIGLLGICLLVVFFSEGLLFISRKRRGRDVDAAEIVSPHTLLALKICLASVCFLAGDSLWGARWVFLNGAIQKTLWIVAHTAGAAFFAAGTVILIITAAKTLLWFNGESLRGGGRDI